MSCLLSFAVAIVRSVNLVSPKGGGCRLMFDFFDLDLNCPDHAIVFAHVLSPQFCCCDCSFGKFSLPKGWWVPSYIRFLRSRSQLSRSRHSFRSCPVSSVLLLRLFVR